jgi:ketosteroid isomerase-like protein
MTDLDQLSAWIDRYVHAWNSNDPTDITALFTPDAEYFTAPFRPPWRGPDEIVRGWLRHQDEPGETTFDWQPLTVSAGVAIIQGTTTYPGTTYSNVWVIRLDDAGRCRHFTEWWMEHPASPSTP